MCAIEVFVWKRVRFHTALTGIHPLHIESEMYKKNKNIKIEDVCVSMDDLHEI